MRSPEPWSAWPAKVSTLLSTERATVRIPAPLTLQEAPNPERPVHVALWSLEGNSSKYIMCYDLNQQGPEREDQKKEDQKKEKGPEERKK